VARTVKLVDKSACLWYTPDVFDNRKDPEPFAVLLRPMSAEDLQRMQEAHQEEEVRRLVAKERGSKAEQPGARLVDAMIEKHVIEVRGYTGTDSAGVSVVPRNGAELLALIYAAGSEELSLRNDISLALQERSRLDAGLEKKLDTPSASSSPVATIPQASGHAPYAAGAKKIQAPSSEVIPTAASGDVSQTQRQSLSPGHPD